VIVSLEDLWGERDPQNVPGTPSEQNWRRKAALTLEDMRSVEGLLREIDEARRFGKATGR
jgi:4-alpha-glucanotransferase